MNFKVRPWISWADFALMCTACAILLFFEWVEYRDGFHYRADFFFALPLLLAIPVLGLTLVIRPLLSKKKDRSLHHLWIRPLLLGIGFASLWTTHRISPFYDSEITPVLKGRLDCAQSLITDEMLAELRKLALTKKEEPGADPAWINVQVEEMPAFLLKHAWGQPRPLELIPYKTGIEIDVGWGWALEGYFGILIDPEKSPKEGKFESPDGAYRFYRKLADNVYFYHSNG